MMKCRDKYSHSLLYALPTEASSGGQRGNLTPPPLQILKQGSEKKKNGENGKRHLHTSIQKHGGPFGKQDWYSMISIGTF